MAKGASFSKLTFLYKFVKEPASFLQVTLQYPFQVFTSRLLLLKNFLSPLWKIKGHSWLKIAFASPLVTFD